jgi:glutaredoxin 3
MNIEIYSKTNCMFCDKTKIILQKYNPKVLMLDQDFDRESFFKKFPNARTFPQIKINQEHIGGYTELIKWLEKNSLDEDF